ncbi:hypothetical protein GCM10011371_22770 [Novosphingobium marinum]|nr:hypothetical protein GCM10011371_22770 [Novosphingobium marinum]
MEALFRSGHAADIVMTVLILEAVWLILRGWRAIDVVLLILPAVLIVASLRAALVGASWPWIALPLALSFPVHVADLLRRRRDTPAA